MSSFVQIVPLAGHSNTASVESALTRLGFEVSRVQPGKPISTSVPLIIPGVGTFSNAMNYLRATGLDEVILTHGGKDAPLVGICLGFQILFQTGTEGAVSDTPGLGLIPGIVSPLLVDGARTTNIGWHELPIGAGGANPVVYFCHSFHVRSEIPDGVEIGLGGGQVLAMAKVGGIQGFQFHPELSGPNGLRLLARALDPLLPEGQWPFEG